MHELSLTQQLVDLVVGRARAADAAKITAVHLSIGALSGVDAEAVTFCFELVARGTLAEGALLQIEHVPIVIECRDCARQSEVIELALWCPRCEGTNVRLVKGREFRVHSLEVE